MQKQSKSFSELIQSTHAFTEKSAARSWFHVLSTLVVIVIFGILTQAPLPLGLRILSSLLMGLVGVCYFTIYHDYAHGAILRKSPVAKVWMFISGLMFLRPPGEWRRTHNFHHAHNTQMATSNVGSFPTMTVQDWEASSPKKKLAYKIIRNPLVIVFGYVTVFLLEAFKKLFFLDPWGKVESALALVLHFFLLALCIRAGIDAVLLTFFLPYLVSCSVGAYLFYVQHNFEGIKLRPDDEWEFGFAALNSSSCIKAGKIFHWFTGNIGYHHIHHLNPKIPLYRLPEAMAAIEELQSPTFVKLTPRTVWRSLGLKLWDPATQEMVGYSRSY